MSGGEKARLVLCMLVWQRPNLLLMDEPTNHLDLATREALSMALNEFEGTVMLVSHDRALLRAVCDEFWMVSRGGVEPFDGDLDDYQKYLLDETKRQRELAKEEAKNQSPKATAVSGSSTASMACANAPTSRGSANTQASCRCVSSLAIPQNAGALTTTARAQDMASSTTMPKVSSKVGCTSASQAQ